MTDIERWKTSQSSLHRNRAASPEALLAMVRAGQDDMEPLIEVVQRYAPRVPDAAPLLLEELPFLDGGARALAFHALASLTLDDAELTLLLDEVRIALYGSGQAAQAAASVAGKLGHDLPGLAWELAAVLDRVDISDQLRHCAVQGLVDLLVAVPDPDPAIRGRLEREAARDTGDGRLARWFIELRPTG
jgi:hypothetical protein